MTATFHYFMDLIRRIAALLAMVLVWLVLGMVYLDAFPAPLGRLEALLMPWKALFTMPVFSLGGRVSFMQGLLDASATVADVSLITMMLSFCLFGGYLTLLYQQRKRRSRENRTLLRKNREIARRNEFIRYISATIGHEFKNNLGRIKRRIGLLECLSEDERVRIEGNFQRLFADIEVFRKIADEREAGLVEFSMVDLGEMLKEMALQYADLAEVQITAGPVDPCIFASRDLLRTVFETLMDNAVKYKKPGQDRAAIKLAMKTDEDGKRRYLALSFRDEGQGMREDQAEHCFYGNAESTDGWGKGLYFAKYVVGLHAGKIRVGKEYTSEDSGTEIIIHLPFVEEAVDV